MEDKINFKKCSKCYTNQDKLWYSLVKSNRCETILHSYHSLYECITKLLHNLDILYKNYKKLNCEFIPPYRPSGGYLRYAILINPTDKIHLKKCLEVCLKARKTTSFIM